MKQREKELFDALKNQKEALESKGYVVAYICVHGSQNYGLDIYTEDYQSDIDIKAVVVPTLDDLIENSKPVSEVVKTEWGQCDVKDIRSYTQTLLKANPAYLETLLTNYYINDENFEEEINQMRENCENLIQTLKAQVIRAMYGMMCEKQKALKHPYPTIAHKIEKWGYDGKQAHHVARLYNMMEDYYLNNLTMKESTHPEYTTANFELLMNLKLNIFTLEEAEALVKSTMDSAKELKDRILSEIDESTINYSVKEEYLKLSQEIIKKRVVSDYSMEG